MKRINKVSLIFGGGAFLLLIVGAFLARPEKQTDLEFLKGFHYDVTHEDGESRYRIDGDSAKIVAAIPGASSAEVEVSPQGTTYNFYLPSGKAAVLVTSGKPNKPSHLIFDDKVTSWWTRIFHRIGLV